MQSRAWKTASEHDEGDAAYEGQLFELARTGGPLRRCISALAARLIATQGWSRLGFARLGDYARERLGISARSVQELGRVGSQLDALPRLEAALVSGMLPWSKVRLLARFVSPLDEEDWIERAAGLSVRQLERTVRQTDRGAIESGVLGHAGEGPRDTRWVRLRVPAPLAFKWQQARVCASRIEGGPLSPGDVLERVTAEVVSALNLELESEPISLQPGTIDAPRAGIDRWTEDGGGSRSEEGDTGRDRDAVDAEACIERSSRPSQPPADLPAAPPAGIPVFLQPLLADLHTADAFEIDARLRRVVRLEQRLDAELAPLLRRVTTRDLEWSKRYASLEELARDLLGMSPSKARALLRVERLGDVCPALRDAYRGGSLSWVRAQALVPLLSGDAEGTWREAWVAYASTVTVRRLKEAVERACLWRKARPAAFARCVDEPRAFAPPDASRAAEPRQTCAPPEDVLGGVRLRIAAPADVARLFDAVLCTLRRAIERRAGRLPPECEVFEAMIDHALESWHVEHDWLCRRLSRKHRVILDRDDWRCVFPGCTSSSNLHVHHIVFRSAGGSDEPSNLTTLCAFHHQRGVHGGTASVRGHAPDRLEFALAARAGSTPLARYRSGDVVVT